MDFGKTSSGRVACFILGACLGAGKPPTSQAADQNASLMARPGAGLSFPASPAAINTIKVFKSESNSNTGLVVFDEPALLSATERGGKVNLEGLPLGVGSAVTLEVEPLRVVGPKTKIVLGHKGGIDAPVAFDFSSVHLFRGKVQGHPDSNVVLFSSPRGVRAHIDLGRADQRYLLSSIGSDAQTAGPTLAEVRPFKQSASRLPDVPLCGKDDVSLLKEAGSAAGCCFEPPPETVYNNRLAVTEIAIETDYELYANFNDPAVTTDYIIELIARTSAIFMRDISTRFEIVYIRLFDNPANEPSFMSHADPLGGYINYWNTNMGSIARDTGAFLTGRRDLPYGGIAQIGAICSDLAYCVCGYLNGFPDPTRPNTGDYDLGVVAHELGHNFNACHTPDYCPQVDQCYPPPVTPQRGTMMSYCSQTVSGGNLVTELWYHTRLRRVMRDFVEFDAFCISYDCDQNGIDDAIDISAPGADVNGNGVLDRCEDCNANGILDPADISSLTSADLNGNGIPDECEPDCNHNNVPDDLDILLNTSIDLWGNGVPDECDPDCDLNGVADYNQIQENLSLDIDRNAVLDSCQDCDGDGINDIVELQGARSAWVASDVLNYVGQYHAISGVQEKISTTGQINGAQDLIVAPGNRVLVSSANTNKVVAFHSITGAHLGDFVAAGSGGLSYPTGLTFGPNGNLFVSSRNSNSVLQYNGTTGAFINAFVPAGSGGLIGPFGLLFGPNGNLFVTSAGAEVLEYHGSTGAFVRKFVIAANNGGLSGARGMVFKPDGNLLVASYNTDALLQYNGTTGAFINKWNSGGTTEALYLDGPWGLRLGPNGNIYSTRDLPSALGGDNHDDDHDHGDWDAGVAHLTAPLHVTSARIMEFDIANGQYLESFILGDDTGLRSATGFDFMPGTADCNFSMIPDACEPLGTDCNHNGIRDACDTVSGASTDCNHNLIPDECESLGGDCNTNGVPDICDLVVHGDCNGNGTPDDCDAGTTSSDRNNDHVPDECQGSCCECGPCSNLSALECSIRGGIFAGPNILCGEAGACVSPIMAHDFCAQAFKVPSAPYFSVPIDNRCAGSDAPYEVPCPADTPLGSDLWFTYTAPCSGMMEFSTCDTTDFDAMLAIYGSGTTCNCPTTNATLISCEDDSCGIGGGPPVVVRSVVAGRCYTLRLGGWDGSTGIGDLNISYLTACNPTDLNASGSTDLRDFALLENCFGTVRTGCGSSDFNQDGVVNLEDYRALHTMLGM